MVIAISSSLFNVAICYYFQNMVLYSIGVLPVKKNKCTIILFVKYNH